MLPRVATTTGTAQPTPAPAAGASVDAAVRPQLSAAALANLRAEVVLRLIETLLKHMPRTGVPSPNRDLLETLLAVLKTLPGREGESGRKLADLIAKLPPEMRPAVEKLISTVLSAVPTRTLVEIVRNPNGPEAQKLATLLATNLTAQDNHTTEGHAASGQTAQQKPVALTAQQLAVVGRHSLQQAAQMAQLLTGDARSLQVMLKRIFDFDGANKPNIANTRTADIPATAAKPATAVESKATETTAKTEGAEKHATAKTDTAGKTELRIAAAIRTALIGSTPMAEKAETPATTLKTAFAEPTQQVEETPAFQRTSETRPAATVPAAALADDQPASEADETILADPAGSEKTETAASTTAKREDLPGRTPLANATGQAPAHSVLEAVTRDLPPALLTEAVVHLVENLSPEEATFLRTLLERPLDLVMPPEGDVPETPPPLTEETLADAVATAEQDAEMATADLPEEAPRARPDPGQTASVPARQTQIVTEETRPAQRLAENGIAQAQAAAQPDLALPTAIAVREGVPLAFVPYLPAEEDLEWSENREADEDEASDEDGTPDNQDGGEKDADDAAGESDEPETPEMARRREKTAEMVGVIEPGLVFYQKLGGYWT